MTKKEAIQAMLDGKKVRHEDFNEDQYFMFSKDFCNLIDEQGEKYILKDMEQDNWFIYQEPPKFKVGDRITRYDTTVTYLITDIIKDYYKTLVGAIPIEQTHLYYKVKTESWAKFRCCNSSRDKKFKTYWIESQALYKTLEEFTKGWKGYSHHHEVEGSRVDLPVVED